MLIVLLDMMCCIIWHCLKHEAQNTFSYYLEHLNDDTSLFPPQKCYKDASIILTTTQNYLSLRAKNFHSCRKKIKKEFERSSWLVHTCLRYCCKCWRHLPCLHKSPVQVQSSTKASELVSLQGHIHLPSEKNTDSQTRPFWYLCYQVFTF